MLHYDKIVEYNRIMEYAAAHPVKRRRRYVVRNPDGTVYQPKKSKTSSGSSSSAAS